MVKTHLKIFYIGSCQGFHNADRYYLIPQRMLNGFTRLGHVFYAFNDRDVARASTIFNSSKLGRKSMNQKLVKDCVAYRPDLIILGHCTLVTNDTLGILREKLPDTPIIYRNVDPLNYQQNRDDLSNRIDHVDWTFITTAGKSLESFSSKKTKVTHIPNPVDKAIDVHRNFGQDTLPIDLFFAGSVLHNREDHRQALISDLLPQISNVTTRIIGAGQEDRVFGADYYDLLAQSKMGLCLNKTNNEYLYASDRFSQYLGNGLLTFIHEGPRFQELLGDAIVTYRSIEDLTAKLLKFHGDDALRKQTAERAHTLAHDMFDVEKVCQYMIDCAFFAKATQDYAWDTTVYGG